ncbi:hypothetical protein [Acaryochloris sp. IP29b_bin.148]|uniref:hypothetical protein n=1 Tax=Acaryochloris sp. IP29b_bin.148 TaxID=2969218 RepID=UPI002631D253|nr:hypothetical protein [Acaryochloris sp. IP29b_bin.148]
MSFKPSFISQLSLLTVSICLSFQHQIVSAEQISKSAASPSSQGLELTTPSPGDSPLNSSFVGDDLSNLFPNPARSTPVNRTHKSHHLPLQTEAIEQPLNQNPESDSAVKLDLIYSEISRQENANFLPKTSSQSTISNNGPSSSELRAITNANRVDLDHRPPIPAHPQALADRLGQVPEAPNATESAGRRPSLRTQPTIPDEAPLDLRQEVLTPKKIYSPSISILTPSAYGKSWRQASVGLGIQHRTRFTDSADGAFGVGFGLGDARKYVGLDVGVALTDLDSFDRGIISFKLHRHLPDLFAVAVGVNDALGWGNGDVNGPSPYGVVTKTFVLKENTKDLLSRIYVSAGAGTGRYRTESNIINDSDTPGIFGSLAVRVVDPMNVIAEWSGQDLSLGVSLRPFQQVPIIITPAITDITGTAGDGVRFIVGIGYALSF